MSRALLRVCHTRQGAPMSYMDLTFAYSSNTFTVNTSGYMDEYVDPETEETLIDGSLWIDWRNGAEFYSLNLSDSWGDLSGAWDFFDVSDGIYSLKIDATQNWTGETLQRSLSVYISTGTATDQVLWASIADDVVFTGDRHDAVYLQSGSDYAVLGGGDDMVNAGSGNDYLDGGTGWDTMFGGTGNDTYVFDNIEDSAFEKSFSGIDTVVTSVSLTGNNALGAPATTAVLYSGAPWWGSGLVAWAFARLGGVGAAS